MVRGRLPIRVEFDRKGIDLHSVLCPMCDNACESIDHGIVLYSEVIKENVIKKYSFMASGCLENGILYLEKS
ncbi:hypothetical protein Tco_1277599 [Tanacetum coccineum]